MLVYLGYGFVEELKTNTICLSVSLCLYLMLFDVVYKDVDSVQIFKLFVENKTKIC